MSADVGLNAELLRLAERGNKMDQERLMTAAHENGHGLGELLGEGTAPEWVKVNHGWFITNGRCQWGEMPSREWPRDRKVARLVTHIAGHAAETRFCRLYLGMDDRKAWRVGRDWSDGDYDDFRFWRSRLGLWWSGVSPERAFERATELLAPWSEVLDALTVRLHRARYLPGSELAAAVSTGPGRRRTKVRRPVDAMKVRVGGRPEPREPEPERLDDVAGEDWAEPDEDSDFEVPDDVLAQVAEGIAAICESWEDEEEWTA